MKEITNAHSAIRAGSSEEFTLSDSGICRPMPEFTRHQNLLSQVLFQVPVQDLYQRLCHADRDKKQWVMSLFKEYDSKETADAFIRFALGPHKEGSFYFDKEQDELIAHVKKTDDVSEAFKAYKHVTHLNLYYEGEDIRPFIQILNQMQSLKKLTFYFSHVPLMNHFRPRHIIFAEKFASIEKVSFSNDLTLKQMLDSLTLFPRAKEVNVSASRQAFDSLRQEDADRLKKLLSPQLHQLAIPHDVSESVLKMLIDVGLKDQIVDLHYKKEYDQTSI